MITRAQEYLLNRAKEQLKLAEEEIPKINNKYYQLKTDSEIKDSVYPEVIEGIIHTKGYWEGVSMISEFIINTLTLNESEFEKYLMDMKKEQLMVEKTINENLGDNNLKNL